MATKKKKEEKPSVASIMDEIIDKEALAKRKEASKQHLPKKRVIPKKEEKPKELKWFEKVMSLDCFTKKVSKKGDTYVQHKDWKPNIWVGPYDDKTADRVIADYIKNSKKSPMYRKPIKDLHSVIIAEDKWDSI